MVKQYLLRIWVIIDPLYYFFTRLKFVFDHNKQYTVFRVRLTRYKGRTIQLTDGTVIKKNDVLLKIHLHNVKLLYELMSIKSDKQRALHVFKQIKVALPILALYVEEAYCDKPIKGIIGISTLYKGANRLGFEIIPLHNKLYQHYKGFTFGLINYLANKPMKQVPMYLFMSKQELSKKMNL